MWNLYSKPKTFLAMKCLKMQTCMSINDPIGAPQWRTGNNGYLSEFLHFCKTLFENLYIKKNFFKFKKKPIYKKKIKNKKNWKIKIMKKNVLVFMIQKTFYKSFK
jgi:hypothetical protein